MQPMVVESLNFIDLYLVSDGLAEVCDAEGLRPINSEELNDDLKKLRDECIKASEDMQEFTLWRSVGDERYMYRGTKIQSSESECVFVLRRVELKTRDLLSIGLTGDMRALITAPQSTGLVLVTGPMQSGKTTTAASMLKARMDAVPGISSVLEDPPETRLSGRVGKGRCIQVHAGRHNGGYKEQITLALRSGANTIFIGEIRDKSTAIEVVNAASSGHLLISTIHADSLGSAVERLVNLSGMGSSVIADCITAVTHQVMRNAGVGAARRLVLKEVIIESDIRAAVKDENYEALDAASEQKRRNVRSLGVGRE
ncbi:MULTISPECIES: ATPase, T2SS/T4P/T4SS family [Aeromonas]|uniref:ATPase, T2SS/T4P/T4SS family n=1 Tax=Aeromonas TaxID=642 RepID=UPI002B0607EC|nr:ATPase, T2SS/T4P/T4SS family [Aeromonas jandaei]